MSMKLRGKVAVVTGAAALGEKVHRRFVEYRQQGLLVPPEKLARLALFLASPESDNVTGEIGGEADFALFGYRRV